MGFLGSVLGAGFMGFGANPGTVAGAIGGSKVEDKFNENAKGTDAGNSLENNPGIQNMLKEAEMSKDPKMQAALASYRNGQGSLTDILNSSSDPGFLSRALATDPTTGTKMATEQVQNNPLLSGLFGKDGMQDRMLNEEKDLSSRGWTMKPEDNEAYGQASDETARLASQEEGSLSQALASRGLAAGPSGAAQVGFSGIQGNKFERLASAQRKIADDRMKMNQTRLQAVRDTALKSGQQAETALQDQFTRNKTGVDDYHNVQLDAAKAGQAVQGQQNIEFDQHQATQGPSLAEIFGSGAGMAAGGYLGGAKGAQMGSTLGGALGNGMSKRG